MSSDELLAEWRGWAREIEPRATDSEMRLALTRQLAAAQASREALEAVGKLAQRMEGLERVLGSIADYMGRQAKAKLHRIDVDMSPWPPGGNGG